MVITLVLSGALISLGAAIQGGDSPQAWVGIPLVVLGSCCAAVCVTLWVVCVLDPARRPCRTETPRIRRVIDQLLGAAATADTRGILALPQSPLCTDIPLFGAGVPMLIAGEPAGAIRTALLSRSDALAEAARVRRARIRRACDALPVLTLMLALLLVGWTFGAIVQGSSLGTLMPLGLLASVYGAFAIAAIAVAFADRLSVAASEQELCAMLVIETLVGLRSGESADRIRARLRTLVPDGEPATASIPLRKAA
jgi:flagellar motor component MotA